MQSVREVCWRLLEAGAQSAREPLESGNQLFTKVGPWGVQNLGTRKFGRGEPPVTSCPVSRIPATLDSYAMLTGAVVLALLAALALACFFVVAR